MARNFEHTVTSTMSVSEVHAVLTSERYWRERTEKIGGPGAEILSLAIGAEGADADARTVEVSLTQAIPAAVLPSMVTAIRPGDLIINRSENWAAVSGGAAAGTFEATVDGAPARLWGTLSVEPAVNGSTMRVDGKAEVKIPLFGSKIEQAVIEQVLQLIDTEFAFTGTWSE